MATGALIDATGAAAFTAGATGFAAGSLAAVVWAPLALATEDLAADDLLARIFAAAEDFSGVLVEVFGISLLAFVVGAADLCGVGLDEPTLDPAFAAPDRPAAVLLALVREAETLPPDLAAAVLFDPLTWLGTVRVFDAPRVTAADGLAAFALEDFTFEDFACEDLDFEGLAELFLRVLLDTVLRVALPRPCCGVFREPRQGRDTGESGFG